MLVETWARPWRPATRLASLRARFEYLKWAEEWVKGWDGTGIDDDKRLCAVAMLDDAAGELDAIASELEAKLQTEG